MRAAKDNAVCAGVKERLKGGLNGFFRFRAIQDATLDKLYKALSNVLHYLYVTLIKAPCIKVF